MTWTTDSVKEAKTLVGWVKDRAVALILAAILLLTLAAELHLLGSLHEHPFILLTIVGGMIYFLRHDVVAAQSANVELMREALSGAGELRTLESAMMDLAPRLEAVKRDEKVRIDHLGLNMSAAWDRLCPVIEKLVMRNKARVRFRLLILGEGGSGGMGVVERAKPGLPAAVEGWLVSGDTRRLVIERALKGIQDEALLAGADAGSLEYEIRSYRDLPVVHGIRIWGKPDAAYVAFSRWDDERREDDKFWWGGDQYHRILEPASPDQIDLRAIQEGYFRRWWKMNEPADRPKAA